MIKKGEKMKDLLAKPNQLIEVEGTLSLGQLKVYNVLLAEVHNSIQNARKKGTITEDTTKESYVINYRDLKKRAGLNEKDDNKIRKYIEDIGRVSITLTDKHSKDWAVLGLLSQAVYKEADGNIHIELPSIIRKSLYASNYYTTLDLLLIKTLKSKYSVILYELLKKYEGVQIPKYDIESFAKVFQTKYKNFYDIKRYILDKAIPEIVEKTGYKVSYETKKVGRKIAYIKLKCEKKGTVLENVLEAEIVEEVRITQGDSLAMLTGKDEDRLEKAISKAKKNLYISKAWNKRADNKIRAVIEKQGEDYAVEMLRRAYDGCQREIEKTLVQYFNGILKNMKLEEDELREKREKSTIPTAKKEAKEVKTQPTKEKLVVQPIPKADVKAETEQIDHYAIFESLNEEAKKDILDKARKYYLNETGTADFNPVHEKIFNMTKKSYINRILGA